MSMSVGASSNALSYLQSLLQQGQSGAGASAATADPMSMLLDTMTAAPSGASGQATPATSAAGSPAFGADTLGAMISLQGGTSSSLFAQIDTNGDGQITKSEFEDALGKAGVSTSNADKAFAALDSNDDGSIGQSELDPPKSGRAHGHHHGHAGGAGGSKDASDSSSATNADGSTTLTTTNPDGSTTTTVTYSDGTSMASTVAASPAMAGGGTQTNGSGNQDAADLMQMLEQMQAQLLPAAATVLSTFV